MTKTIEGECNMSSNQLTISGTARIIHAFAVTTTMLLISLSQPVFAQQVTMETLLDRIQIEDLLTRYYYDLSQGNAHELSEYFTEDALLDVDGTVAKGRAEIAKLYQSPEPDPKEPAPRRVVVAHAAYQPDHQNQRQYGHGACDLDRRDERGDRQTTPDLRTGS